MSALGNGSLSGSDFKAGNILPNPSVSATGGFTHKFESNQVGGKRVRRSRSIRSTRPYGLTSTLRLGGKKRRTTNKKSRKHRKSKK